MITLDIKNLRVVERENFLKWWKAREVTKKEVYSTIENKQKADYIVRIFTIYGWIK